MTDSALEAHLAGRQKAESSRPALRVSMLPTLSPTVLLSLSRNTGLPDPLREGDTSLFFNGRNAIWALLSRLRLCPGCNVLLPSYNCGVELDPFLRFGVSVRFYRISPSLGIDLESVEKATDHNTRAILATHFFGFSHSVELLVQFCRKHGLLLIEDCAHALYSEYCCRRLGSFGDASVFSLRKFLPIPNGGALLVNDPALRVSGQRPKRPPALETAIVLRHLIEADLLFRSGRFGVAAKSGIVDPLIRFLKTFAQPMRGLQCPAPLTSAMASWDFHPERADWGIAAVSEAILRRTNHSEIRRRRRENFLFLLSELDGLKKVKPVFERLEEGACPSFFPVFVDRPVDAREHLRRHGIESTAFWLRFHDRFPKDDFPEAVFLKTHILALPIHQDLEFNQLRLMARTAVAFDR